MSDTGLSRFSSEVPAHLKDFQGDAGASQFAEFSRPKFLRVVQNTGDLMVDFTPKTVLKMSATSKEVYMQPDEKVYVVPVFYCKEYGIWYHNDAKVQNPVKERTFDPKSALAQRCMDQRMWGVDDEDPDHKDAKGNPLPLMYRTMLHIALAVYDKGPEGKMDLVLTSFKGGEYRSGSSFLERIGEQVRAHDYPMYGFVYEMSVGRHSKKNTNYNWWGFDFDQAGFSPKEDQEFLADAHKRFHDTYELSLSAPDAENGFSPDFSGDTGDGADSVQQTSNVAESRF